MATFCRGFDSYHKENNNRIQLISSIFFMESGVLATCLEGLTQFTYRKGYNRYVFLVFPDDSIELESKTSRTTRWLLFNNIKYF